ncbi:DUF397 domain-containing protein [Streptomyces sulphureus]|uniref:DUF397 domain-containing protein n=1 Tax=Streptomyces sulphureus TaxID=47758 RepID=UPI00035E2AB6|nr:DUF397 domain-containing protein [Streptomyces sulphureus]
MKNNTEWFKSSYSTHDRACVEVRSASATVSARDTKDRTRGELTVPAAGWSAFVAGVTAGELE